MVSAGKVSTEAFLRPRVVGDAERRVSAAFLRVPASGERRIFTAASLREAALPDTAAVLRVVRVVVSARGLRVAVVADLVARPAVVLRVVLGRPGPLRALVAARAGVLRATAAARGLRAGALDAARLAPRAGAALAVRVVDRVGVLVARVAGRAAVLVVAFLVEPALAAPILDDAVRVAVALRAVVLVAAALRAGAARVAATRFAVVRVPVARLVVGRVATALVARFAGALAAVRVPVFAAVAREVADLLPSFFAAADRAAGVFAVLVVRATEVRLPVPAVRRPPALTAIALARGPGVFELSSVLIVWPFHSPVSGGVRMGEGWLGLNL